MGTYKTAIRQTRLQSRERIVSAATHLARTTSFGALTVDDVMREAGAGRTIFYRHFDDLAELFMRAGREAFEGLLEAEEALRDAHLEGRPDVRAAIEAAVDVYREHGPLLRVIFEAAATGDERIIAGRQAMLERFDALVIDVLRANARSQALTNAKVAETARALNLLNVNYLLDVFGGGEPRISRETAVETLTAIWSSVIG